MTDTEAYQGGSNHEMWETRNHSNITFSVYKEVIL